MAQDEQGNTIIPGPIAARIAAGKALFDNQSGDNDQPTNPDLVTPPPPPPSNSSPPVVEPDEDARQAPTAGEPPVPETSLERAATDATETARLQQALRTLQGKYSAEVPQLNRMLVTANTELKELRKQLEEGQKKSLTTPAVSSTLLTEDEIREFGPDLVDVIGRKAREVAESLVSAKMAELQGRIEALDGSVDKLGKTAETVAQDQFAAYMDAHLADWRSQDNDPLFIAWLQEPDIYSGIRRFDLLRQAITTSQHSRVEAIFQGYRTETGSYAQQSATAPVVNGHAKPAVDTLAAPSGRRGRTSTIVDAPAPEVLHTDEIKKFYARTHKANHGVPQAEIDAMEARIQRAMHAGTIVSRGRA